MKLLTFNLGIALVVAMTVASAVLQGRIRNRWGPSESMQAAAQELGKAPNSFGGPQNDRWQLIVTETTDRFPDDVIEMLECSGYINRCYENRRTGEKVDVFVVIGPTGPISSHTPEICFSSQNYSSHDTHRAAFPFRPPRSKTMSFGRYRSRRKASVKTCSAFIIAGPRAAAGRPRTTPASRSSARPTFTRSSSPAKCRRGRTCVRPIRAASF